jgi:hypothetical protein
MRKAQRIYYKLNIKSFTFDPIKHTDSRSLYAQDAFIYYTALNLIADSRSLHVNSRIKESICAKHALHFLFLSIIAHAHPSNKTLLIKS